MKKREWYYPNEVREMTTLTHDNSRFIEGYAMACADIMARLTGDSPCGKSYDPMSIEGNTLHSYAFDLRDGGRHHDATIYSNVGEILEDLLKETIEWVELGT